MRRLVNLWNTLSTSDRIQVFGIFTCVVMGVFF